MKNKKSAIIFIIIILFFSVWASIKPIEKSLIYHPANKIMPMISQKTHLDSFFNNKNQKISYIHIDGNIKKPIIVYCHGNSNNASFYQNRVTFLSNHGFEIFMPDYRGFGKSQGNIDENGIYKDVDDFLNYLNKKYNIEKKDIILWGHSLGGAVAAETASKSEFKGVILESTFTNIYQMKIFTMNNRFNPIKKIFYNAMPVSQKFESNKKVANIKSPLLIICSKQDKVIPYTMGIELSKLNKHSTLFVSPKGYHDETGWQQKAILEFINKLIK